MSEIQVEKIFNTKSREKAGDNYRVTAIVSVIFIQSLVYMMRS